MKAPEPPFLEAMKVAVIITDADGLVTYWNPFAQELYGWPAAEVIGRNVMEITVAKGTKEEAEQHMSGVEDTGSGGLGSSRYAARTEDS